MMNIVISQFYKHNVWFEIWDIFHDSAYFTLLILPAEWLYSNFMIEYNNNVI